MESKRRKYKNDYMIKIKTCKSLVSRYTDTIGRLKNSDMSDDYIKNQIELLHSKIKTNKDLVDEYEIKLQDLQSGLMDEMINNEYESNNNTRNENDLESRKKKDKKKEKAKEDERVSRQYSKNIINASRSYRYSKKDHKYAYRYYMKVVSQVPEWMKKDLNKMPNNKAYLWRGVTFYGRKKDTKGPRVTTEKKKGYQIIHEYNKNLCKTYEKQNKQKKKLVSVKKLRPKPFGINLTDYIKN